MVFLRQTLYPLKVKNKIFEIHIFILENVSLTVNFRFRFCNFIHYTIRCLNGNTQFIIANSNYVDIQIFEYFSSYFIQKNIFSISNPHLYLFVIRIIHINRLSHDIVIGVKLSYHRLSWPCTSCNILTDLSFVLTSKYEPHVVHCLLIRIAVVASALHHTFKTKRDTIVFGVKKAG